MQVYPYKFNMWIWTIKMIYFTNLNVKKTKHSAKIMYKNRYPTKTLLIDCSYKYKRF